MSKFVKRVSSHDIITELQDGYLIQPDHIATDVDWWSESFGSHRVATLARWIVKLCQRKGGWSGFTPEEIGEFCNNVGTPPNACTYEPPNVWNCEILEEKGCLRRRGERFYVTHSFIARSFLSHPAVEIDWPVVEAA